MKWYKKAHKDLYQVKLYDTKNPEVDELLAKVIVELNTKKHPQEEVIEEVNEAKEAEEAEETKEEIPIEEQLTEDEELERLQEEQKEQKTQGELE